MYCVKCGVELKQGVNVCPLCHTKMNFEESDIKETSYSNLLPKRRNPNLAYASIFSLLSLITCITTMIICFNIYHKLSWGGYVIASVALFYIIFILPLWFTRLSPIVFVCFDFVSIALLLFYICIKTSGKWFFSFALPIVFFIGVLFIVGISLRKYIKKAGFFIIGGLIIVLGLFCILIELFECITFNTKMFTWSLYVVASTSVFGLFLILCGIIKPLRESLSKRFYI